MVTAAMAAAAVSDEPGSTPRCSDNGGYFASSDFRWLVMASVLMLVGILEFQLWALENFLIGPSLIFFPLPEILSGIVKTNEISCDELLMASKEEIEISGVPA